jgi:hypothetical protein
VSYQTLCSSFKVELLEGYHAFSSAYRAADTFYIALYTSAATLGATTTAYTSSNEATGGNYVAGGQVLVPTVPLISGTTACLNFGNVQWTGSITANSALIYNVSQDNRAVCVLNFGSNKTSTLLFNVTFPPVDDQYQALIRIQ